MTPGPKTPRDFHLPLHSPPFPDRPQGFGVSAPSTWLILSPDKTAALAGGGRMAGPHLPQARSPARPQVSVGRTPP